MNEFSITKNGYRFERDTTMEDLAMNVTPATGWFANTATTS